MISKNELTWVDIQNLAGTIPYFHALLFSHRKIIAAEYRLPRNLHVSGNEGRLFEKDSLHRRGHIDSAIWRCMNLNIHFHMLFLDGVYADRQDGSARFQRVDSPTNQELSRITQTIARRAGRYLQRQGLLERNVGMSGEYRGQYT